MALPWYIKRERIEMGRKGMKSKKSNIIKSNTANTSKKNIATEPPYYSKYQLSKSPLHAMFFA